MNLIPVKSCKIVEFQNIDGGVPKLFLKNLYLLVFFMVNKKEL